MTGRIYLEAVCFIDYSKAFDTVKHEPLIELLQSLDIDPQDVNILANLYWNQQAAVSHNGEISDSMSIRQGFVRVAWLHHIYLLCILK